MSDLDLSRIAACWRDASDADVARALGNPDDYPEEVRAIIAAEARRRGVNAGDIEPFESPLARHGKRGLTAASRFIQSHRVICALALGAGVRLAMLLLGPYAARWPSLFRYGLFPLVCLLGLVAVSWPLRSYRDTAIATLAACVGNTAVNLACLVMYLPGTPGTQGRTWFVQISLAMTAVVLIWSVIGALACCAVRVRNRYLPLRTPGYCVQCGYNLRGLPLPRCPECGLAFDPAQMQSVAGELSPPTASE